MLYAIGNIPSFCHKAAEAHIVSDNILVLKVSQEIYSAGSKLYSELTAQ